MNIDILIQRIRNNVINPRIASYRLRKQFSEFFLSRFTPEEQTVSSGHIVMFHIGRSGSTVLADLLDQHPEIYWNGETFHKISSCSIARRRVEPLFDSYPFQHLRERMRPTRSRHFGFEVKFFHLRKMKLELENFLRGIEDLGIEYFVILERRNYLRKILSSVIGQQAGSFHRPSHTSSGSAQVYIDVDRINIDDQVKPLLCFLNEFHEDFLRLRELLCNRKSLYLTYEDDIYDNPKVGYNKVCGFLDLHRQHDPIIRYGKTNPHHLTDMIGNFTDVQNALSGTKFEWMLNS